LEDYLQIPQAGDPDQASKNLDKNVQSRLYQHDPETGAVSVGAIDEGDL
jgi:hypothetical protein